MEDVAQALPGYAVRALHQAAGSLSRGIAAAILLAGFAWWAPMLLAAAALYARLWLSRRVASFTAGLLRLGPDLQRATYLRDFVLRPTCPGELRVFGFLEWVLERYRWHAEVGLREIAAARPRLGRMLVGVAAAEWASFGVLAVWVAAAALRGSFTAGEAVTCLQAAWMAAEGLAGDPNAEYELGWAMGAIVRVRTVAAEFPHTREASRPPAAAPPPVSPPAVAFEGVAFRYPGAARDAVHDLDLRLAPGESLALVGVNGSGKTTLVKLLLRLHRPTRGRITVDGRDLASIDPQEWRRTVAVLFQDFARWELPLRENVAFGHLALREQVEAMEEVLDRAGALELARRLPLGLDTVLSPRFRGGVQLSAGEWQRVALARALAAVAGGARILVLDEPAASLDLRSEAELYARFLDVTRGLSTIVVSHRLAATRLVDRVVVLEGGRVVESGRYDELLARRGPFWRLYSTQAGALRGEGT
ncbi:MAG: ABC transporter ATP-binding protein [Clostridia bacterium]|nr:ABC transporter ATP-binding protein [Clostridia bacterium]